MNTVPEDETAGQGSVRRVTPPQAVLWDMDGTLVDTEPYWMDTEFALAERHGATWTHEDALDLVGNELTESARQIQQKMGLDLEVEEIVEELLDGVVERVLREVPWRPGARELLTELHERGVPCALVTMSYARFVAPILTHLPEGVFKVIVTGDQVANGKPHPEPYLTAAAALGVPAGDCLAIEDSNTGARSAEAAGCTVLVIENHVPVAPGERRVFRDTLETMTYADLSALQAG